MNKKKTVLVLGNELEEIDKLPILLLPDLQKSFPDLDFLLFDPTEELPSDVSSNVILLDTIVGLTDVTVFYTLDEFVLSPRMTVHDFDLPLFLGMMKKLGRIKDITIIGVPPVIKREKALKEIQKIISSM